MKNEINLTLKEDEVSHILAVLKSFDNLCGVEISKSVYNRIKNQIITSKENDNWILDYYLNNICDKKYNFRKYRYFGEQIYHIAIIYNYHFLELRNKIFCSTDDGIVIIEKDNRENALARIDKLVSGEHYSTVDNLHLALFLLFCDELNIEPLDCKVDSSVEILINKEYMFFHILAPVNKYTLPILMFYLIQNKKCYDKEVFDYWNKFITIYYDIHINEDDLLNTLNYILKLGGY